MTGRRWRWWQWTASALSLVVLLAALIAIWFYGRLRASLPRLEGQTSLPGLQANVQVTRDALGTPLIQGETRLDVARALGWLHAQDRFFQMDLLRRRAAGELAALVGGVALPLDRATRLHGFRGIAQKSLAQLNASERALLEAYTEGVNAGLHALGTKPFEYYLLRADPQPWRAEDSVLVDCAMMLDLAGDNGAYEKALLTLRDVLGREALEFFAPVSTPNDAALDGSTAPLPPIPGANVVDLRKMRITSWQPVTPDGRAATSLENQSGDLRPGSNSFALTGNHTVTGAALVANDMHLNLAVPNIWYRAHLVWNGHQVGGLTLPGAPVVIVGSNGKIAWGFTNSYVDASDLVVVSPFPISPNLYAVPGPEKMRPIEKRREIITVHGGAPEAIDYDWTIWGPIVGQNSRGRPLALHWLAHEPSALNFSLAQLEDATNVDEAVAIAHRSGIPPSNFVVADRTGAIAWTIAGRLPKRVGFDGRLPVEWAYGDRHWDGWRPGEEIPVMRFSAEGKRENSGPAAGATGKINDGRLWTANQRMVGGAALEILGDGGSNRPARAAQIRDDLAKLERAQPTDLLAIQLDDRALFLERWHQLFLGLLTPQNIAGKNSRARLQQAVSKWEGRASVDSISYRMTRAFRAAVAARLFTPLFAGCVDADPQFNWAQFQYEDALWAIVTQKPAHFLPAEFSNWEALLLAAADDVTTAVERSHETVEHATWGRRNTLRINHPLARALPGFLGAWLNLPAEEVPGDSDMPRVQTPTFGASERMVVSPGHEDTGILEMPGGQSGHPLSPYYRAGHSDWVRGAPTPFLPGPPEHTLTLTP